jgi:hypothetical protein
MFFSYLFIYLISFKALPSEGYVDVTMETILGPYLGYNKGRMRPLLNKGVF